MESEQTSVKTKQECGETKKPGDMTRGIYEGDRR